MLAEAEGREEPYAKEGRDIFSWDRDKDKSCEEQRYRQTELSGLALGNVVDGTVKLWSWLAKREREGRSRAVMLHRAKTKLAELIMDNL